MEIRFGRLLEIFRKQEPVQSNRFTSVEYGDEPGRLFKTALDDLVLTWFDDKGVKHSDSYGNLIQNGKTDQNFKRQ